jgi:hypothetical protein
MAPYSGAIIAGMMIPQLIGNLVLQRQLNILQVLDILVEDILDIGSTSMNRGEQEARR